MTITLHTDADTKRRDAAPDLAEALRDALTLIDALMPGVRYIALQDYKALNDVPLAGRAALAKAGL
jgi:hypothetical protein